MPKHNQCLPLRVAWEASPVQQNGCGLLELCACYPIPQLQHCVACCRSCVCFLLLPDKLGIQGLS